MATSKRAKSQMEQRRMRGSDPRYRPVGLLRLGRKYSKLGKMASQK